MPPIKLSTTVWHSSLLPRDGAQINPVVNFTLGVTDVPGVVDEWMTALRGWGPNMGTAKMVCKAYDVSRPKPNYPVYEKETGGGTAGVAAMPREIAMCLSFYAGTNQKRRRGRLYIPAFWGVATGALPERPTAAHRDKVGTLATILQDLGGVDVDWSVWSGVDGQARAVTNWWVDDEWDIQRRRGLRGTTRSAGTTTEDTTREVQIG